MAAKRKAANDPLVSTLSPIHQLMLDALHESKKDALAAMKKFGTLMRERFKNDQKQDMRALFSYSDKSLGEYYLEFERNAGAPHVRAMLDAAFQEGYLQACEDNATVTEAYLKGLN
jgi:hypothetical protein